MNAQPVIDATLKADEKDSRLRGIDSKHVAFRPCVLLPAWINQELRVTRAWSFLTALRSVCSSQRAAAGGWCRGE